MRGGDTAKKEVIEMKFSADFKNKVHKSISLLKEANKAVRAGIDPTNAVCAYNSLVLTIQQEYGGEWWIFRNKAFDGGFENDGYMSSTGGVFNPFRSDIPKKKRLVIDTGKLSVA